MTRLDQNRAAALLAKKAAVPVSAVTGMTIWGNHSDTQYPDYKNAKINGKPATEVISDPAWFTETYIPTVAKRGSAVIKARGASSAASAANAISDSLRALHLPTPRADWFSAAVVSDGSYGIPAGPDLQLPSGLERERSLVDRAGSADRRRRAAAARRIGRRTRLRARRSRRAAGAGLS